MINKTGKMITGSKTNELRIICQVLAAASGKTTARELIHDVSYKLSPEHALFVGSLPWQAEDFSYGG